MKLLVVILGLNLAVITYLPLFQVILCLCVFAVSGLPQDNALIQSSLDVINNLVKIANSWDTNQYSGGYGGGYQNGYNQNLNPGGYGGGYQNGYNQNQNQDPGTNTYQAGGAQSLTGWWGR